VLLGLTLIACAQEPAAVRNGGFEEVGPEGVPAEWAAYGPRNWELSPGAARSGGQGLRMRVSDKQQWLRQQQQGPLTTCACVVSGWFKAAGVAFASAKDEEEHARLYVHVLYKDRPYVEGLQAWADIPPGTYDWRRFSVAVTPNPAWPVAEFWVTVTSQFAAGELLCDDLGVAPAPFAGGATVLDWTNGARPVVITDLSRCEPRSALATSRLRGKWKVLDYEIGPYKGKMLSALAQAAPPPVSLDPKVKGWHAIYVGQVSGKLRLRLDSDPAYVGRTHTHAPVQETFFKAADLTGRKLVLATQSKGTARDCEVAYVKLVPLTEAEVESLRRDRAQRETRRLCTSIDGFSYIYEKGPTTAEEILEEVEEFRDSDIGVLHVAVGGADFVNYPSKVGTVLGIRHGKLLEVYPDDGDRTYSRSMQVMLKNGVNPTKLHIQAGKAMGMKVHVSLRTAAWEYGPPYEEFFTSPFYQQHPEWRCVDRDGTPVARMSFAVPEVRRHLVEVLREAVAFGADGANIIYVRGAPYVLWEEPFAKLFQERYGADAREFDENDPRIQELRVTIMTQFMREVRAMLDGEQRRRGGGPKLGISAFVLADEADNRRFGIDVRGWVAEGLLDEVSPYLHGPGSRARDYDLAFFKAACGDKGVPWRPTVIAWDAPKLDELMRRALRYYDAGATGLTFWDGNSMTTRADSWSVVSRLGHVEELRQRAETAAPVPMTLRPYRLGEFVVGGRYDVNSGF
jgi:hypothetical protein